ncbi:MAG TPA: TonB-dependent receptor [Thermoanaerobaculia bacterium]|nr:TonB-dependent receptor [Thermoanaerobaculia bacterium]
MKWCPKFLLYAALALFAVSAFAQFQTGNIYGKVQAKDGSVLPGVTVTLTGVGAPQTTVTDAQGNFRFISLSPATYTVKAELAGYGTATRSGIGVRVAQNADVTMTLNPSVSESITVTAEAPLLDVRKAGTGVSVSRVELDKIPQSRDPWTVLESSPGVQVDRVNVGGSQSGQQSVYIGKGTTSDQNTWNVDGVNITDMGATGASPTYYDFDAFEEMQVTTSGSDPRVMTPGVQLNMVTKRGTNDLKGSGRYFYTPGSYQSDATVPGEAQSYLTATNRINSVRDYGGEFGGPIWRDHVWGWFAKGDQKISTQQSSAPGAPGAFDNIILRNINAKLNGQILPSNSAVGFFSKGDKVRNARGISPTRLFEASFHQSGPTKIYKIEDTQIVGTSLYLSGMWSKVDGGFSLIPNGGLGPNAPVGLRDISNVRSKNAAFYITERPQKQYGLDGSKFFDLGNMNHELKFGFGYRDTPVTSLSGWPGPVQGYFRERSNAYCNSRGITGTAQCYTAYLYRDSDKRYSEKYNDLYLGDTILMGNLTLQAGLRGDWQKERNTASAVGPNPLLSTPLQLPIKGTGGFTTAYLPPLTFGGDSRDLKWNSVSPRIGLTYALGSAKKTLLRAGYNRYVDQLGSTIGTISPLVYYSYFLITGRDLNGDKIPQRDELKRITGFYYVDPSSPGSPTGTTRADYGMKPQHTDELVIGFDHELMSDFSVGVNATYRRIGDILEFRAEHTQGKGDFFTRSDYVQVGTTSGSYTITNPDGSTHTITVPKVPVYDTKTGDVPTFFVLRNRPGYSRSYYALEGSFTKRLSHNWMMRGNLTWSDWKDHCGSDSVADPTPQITTTGTTPCSGGVFVQRSAGSGSFANVFINSKWVANLNAIYQFPWQISVGANLNARQGYPRPLQEEVDVDSGLTKNVVLGSVGSIRFPNVYELDLRGAKDFRFANRVGLTLAADLFNAPNKRTILQRETDLSVSNADRITEIQTPRVWRFSARVSF